MRRVLAALACLVLIATAPHAHADERILDFWSDIVVDADTSMTVTETIHVHAEGHDIRRGIFRDFPTDYRDRNGRRVRVGFEFLEASRDGEPESWHQERLSNGVRVYLGNIYTELDPGEYRYTLRYRTTRQLGYFADHDELYWNVTGNGWAFAIDHAQASVTLPDGIAAADVAIEGYTGPQGSTARDVAAHVDGKAVARIAATVPLAPQEGLTLVVTFPKGVVAAPDARQRLAWFVEDNRREGIAAIGLLVLAAFLALQWWRVGRDPAPGVIIPQYDPPPGLSPAAVRFIWRRQHDHRAFAADLVELGVRNALRITEKKGTYSIERTVGGAQTSPEAARVLFDALLGSRKTLLFDDKDHALIAAARNAHAKHLEDTYAKANFRRNTAIGCFGAVFAIVVGVVALLADREVPQAPVVLSSVGVFFFAMFAGGLLGSALQARSEGTSAGGRLFGAVLMFLVTIAVGYVLAREASLVFALLVAALALVQVPFSYWMPAATVPGRALLDRIEGLRLYLGVAERDDLARVQAPPMDAAEYQRLFAYAMALEVEKTWGDRLVDAVGPVAAAGVATTMAWYHGSSGGESFSPSSFGGALTQSLSTAISSSSTPPGSSSGSSGGGSSSGSSGGGSSGGGGGGGGGGGW